jgi:hypothetical protein
MALGRGPIYCFGAVRLFVVPDQVRPLQGGAGPMRCGLQCRPQGGLTVFLILSLCGTFLSGHLQHRLKNLDQLFPIPIQPFSIFV